MSDWISVEDCFPVDDMPVLVITFDDEIFIWTYYYDEYGDLWLYDNTGSRITHWMPLPEPPND